MDKFYSEKVRFAWLPVTLVNDGGIRRVWLTKVCRLSFNQALSVDVAHDTTSYWLHNLLLSLRIIKETKFAEKTLTIGEP
jgi:hypothetical protein